jgi:superfamily I DNA/RNA helicase
VRAGTIHSAKGAEADNVLWLTTTTQAVTNALDEPELRNAEIRVAYVAATRARQRLVIGVEPNKRHRYRGPW